MLTQLAFLLNAFYVLLPQFLPHLLPHIAKTSLPTGLPQSTSSEGSLLVDNISSMGRL
jgi:hypothetical protein